MSGFSFDYKKKKDFENKFNVTELYMINNVVCLFL